MAAKDIEAGRAYVLLRIRNQISQGLKTAERELKTFGTYVGTTAGVIAGGSVGALAWPLKLAADMEQASVSFEVFLGSADKAKSLIGQIETMAAKTPFQFDELRDTTQMLLQFGVAQEDVLNQVSNIGDVSGGSSEKLGRLALAYGQVMAKGRLMGQETNQMTESGFNPLQQIATMTGKSMKDLMKEMEAGAISSQMLTAAFAGAAGPGGRFNGMMDKQSGTLTGLISTLWDYSKIAARTFGDTLVPLFKRVMTIGIAAAQGIAAFVNANKELVSTIARVILIVGAVAGAIMGVAVAALGMSFIIGVVASGLGAILSVASTVVSVFGAIAGAIGSAVTVIGSVLSMVGPAILATAGFIVGIPAMIAAAWSGMIGFFVGIPAMISAAIATIFSPIGIVVALIVAGLIAAAVVAYQFRDAIASMFSSAIAAGRNFISGLIGPLINGFRSIWNIFNTTFGAIKSAFLDGELTSAANIAWLGVQAAAWTAAASIAESFTFVLDALGSWIPGFNAIREYVGSMIGSIATAILSGQWALAADIAMAKVQLAVLVPWNYIAATWAHVTTGMGIAWDTFSYGIGTAFSKGSDIIVDGINWLYDKFLWLQKAWADLTGDTQLAIDTTNAQKEMGDYKKILDDIRTKRDAKRTEDYNASVAKQTMDNQNAAAARGKQELDLRNDIAAKEEEIAKAAAATPGGGTIAGNAQIAENQRQMAIRAEAMRRKIKEDEDKEKIIEQAKNAAKLPEGNSANVSGAFSAAAAIALGNSGNNESKNIAKYTKRSADALEEIKRKKELRFGS